MFDANSPQAAGQVSGAAGAAPSLPRVCVLVPVYNGERTIGETLRSILAQTYPNFEVIVVDNASTDRTLDIVETFQDARLSVVRNEKNVGSYGNLNRCMEICRGDLTAIYHADDVYLPAMIESQVEAFMRHPGVGVVFTHATLIDESGQPVGEVDMPSALLRRPPQPQGFGEILRLLMRHGNYIITPSAMVRTGIYKDTIRVWNEERYHTGADLDTWFRILERHQALVLPDRLMCYRISKNQHSYQINRLRTTRSDFFRVIDAYLALPEVKQQARPEDWQGYRSLDRADQMIRSLNYLLAGRPDEAAKLAHGVLAPEALAEALKNRRGLKTVLLGAALCLGVSLRLQSPLTLFLKRIYRFY